MGQSRAVLLAILLVAVVFLAYDTHGNMGQLADNVRATLADLRGAR